jgi:hypothetical protein
MLSNAPRHFVVLVAFVVSAAAFSGGCAHRPAAPPVVKIQKPPEPWFTARSFCTLPFGDAELPQTSGQLSRSITDSWRKALTLADPAKLVTIVGGRYPAIDAMRIDLTGSSYTPSGKPSASASTTPPEPRAGAPAFFVSQFALVAEPMLSRKGALNLQVVASDVRFELQKTKQGHPYLMMADVGSGALHFDASTADLERIMLAMAKEMSAGKPITIRSVDLNFTSRGDRSLDADLHVSTLVGFIPAGLRFTCRVDVDDAMNAKISDLQVEGDELLGPLMTQFIRPSLAKYDGKTKPLIGFPNQRVKLKDVRIVAGERVTLDAVFGR